jgi:hypothetical protein
MIPLQADPETSQCKAGSVQSSNISPGIFLRVCVFRVDEAIKGNLYLLHLNRTVLPVNG